MHAVSQSATTPGGRRRLSHTGVRQTCDGSVITCTSVSRAVPCSISNAAYELRLASPWQRLHLLTYNHSMLKCCYKLHF